MTTHQYTDIRDALASHPVVTLVGGRGTGKTQTADLLEKELGASEIVVARLDARDLETPQEADRTIASCLGCDVDDLTAENLAQDSVVRFIVDDCHAFFDKRWFPYVQEQWRALLSSPASRGRVAMLLLGRPLLSETLQGAMDRRF